VPTYLCLSSQVRNAPSLQYPSLTNACTPPVHQRSAGVWCITCNRCVPAGHDGGAGLDFQQSTSIGAADTSMQALAKAKAAAQTQVLQKIA